MKKYPIGTKFRSRGISILTVVGYDGTFQGEVRHITDNEWAGGYTPSFIESRLYKYTNKVGGKLL